MNNIENNNNDSNNFISKLSKKDIAALIYIKKASIIYKRNLRNRSRRSIRFVSRKMKLFYSED